MDSGHLFEESLPADPQEIASGSDSDPVEDALSQQGHLTCLRRYQSAKQKVRDALRNDRVPASWAQETIAYFRAEHASAEAARAEWSLVVLGLPRHA